MKSWKLIIPHTKKRFIVDFGCKDNYVFIICREKGFPKLIIYNTLNHKQYYVSFPETFFSIEVPSIYNLDSTIPYLFIEYSSMKTPMITYKLDMSTNKLLIQKQDKFQSFKPANYFTGYFQVSSQLYITYMYHKQCITLDGKKTYPCLLHGYGAYGHTLDESFSSSIISLVDRGFLYCIAHIRGSSFQGKQWYKDGKLLHKMNTFIDFETCASYLISKKYTSSSQLTIYGASAGGLLMGACINRDPSLYNIAIMGSPWLDALSTMLNPNSPLTTMEYNEWGNPNQKKYYDYMLQYSPYDNINENYDYPHIFISSGSNDSVVPISDSLKYYAKIRNSHIFKHNLKTITLKISDFGHSGTNKRYEGIHETCKIYSFILKYTH